jgi:hypothetical protein
MAIPALINGTESCASVTGLLLIISIRTGLIVFALVNILLDSPLLTMFIRLYYDLNIFLAPPIISVTVQHIVLH